MLITTFRKNFINKQKYLVYFLECNLNGIILVDKAGRSFVKSIYLTFKYIWPPCTNSEPIIKIHKIGKLRYEL